MSEEKFWLCIWTLAAVTLCTVIAIIAVAHSNTNAAITELVKQGQSPMAASCALGRVSNASICTTATTTNR
jgi:hypothetical protein